jgi:hypothetical protein
MRDGVPQWPLPQPRKGACFRRQIKPGPGAVSAGSCISTHRTRPRTRHCRCKTKFEAGEEGVLVTRRGLQVSPGQRLDVAASRQGERAAQASGNFHSQIVVLGAPSWTSWLSGRQWGRQGGEQCASSEHAVHNVARRGPWIRGMEQAAGDGRTLDCTPRWW